MRTIQLKFDLEHIDEQRSEHHAEYQKMLGRLCNWNIDGFDQVDIYPDRKKGDLTAVYTSSTNDNKYVIGAFWHDDTCTYSFHS